MAPFSTDYIETYRANDESRGSTHRLGKHGTSISLPLHKKFDSDKLSSLQEKKLLSRTRKASVIYSLFMHPHILPTYIVFSSS